MWGIAKSVMSVHRNSNYVKNMNMCAQEKSVLYKVKFNQNDASELAMLLIS